MKVRILTFKLLNLFKSWLMALVCIPEFLMHLLRPIQPYLYLTCVWWHMRQIWHFWHFWHKWHIWHPIIVVVRYGNMSFKRLVRASGMQTNAIKQRLNIYYGLKSQNTHFQNFPLYFLKILIFWATLLLAEFILNI